MAFSGHLLAFLQNIGMPELLVCAFVALLLFGRRLPEVGRSLGKGIIEFKKGLQDTTDEIKRDPPPSNSSGTPSSSGSEKKLEPPREG